MWPENWSSLHGSFARCESLEAFTRYAQALNEGDPEFWDDYISAQDHLGLPKAAPRAIARLQAQRERRAQLGEVILVPKIIAEYERNQVAGDEEFKGRTRLSGNVVSITKNLLDKPYLILGPALDEFESSRMQAEFVKAAIRNLAKLSKGEQVIADRQVRGLYLGTVTTSDCELEWKTKWSSFLD